METRVRVEAIEALGGEAVEPTMAEWFFYVNHVRTKQNQVKRRYTEMLKDMAARQIMLRDEKKVYAIFDKTTDAEPEERQPNHEWHACMAHV